MTVARVAAAALALLLAAACTSPAPPRGQAGTGATPVCSPP
jgi:carboxyl-terminal processing protease